MKGHKAFLARLAEEGPIPNRTVRAAGAIRSHHDASHRRVPLMPGSHYPIVPPVTALGRRNLDNPNNPGNGYGPSS